MLNEYASAGLSYSEEGYAAIEQAARSGGTLSFYVAVELLHLALQDARDGNSYAADGDTDVALGWLASHFAELNEATAAASDNGDGAESGSSEPTQEATGP